jgi:hypothetical protein
MKDQFAADIFFRKKSGTVYFETTLWFKAIDTNEGIGELLYARQLWD